MTTFYVFSITRMKEINLDIVEINDEENIADPYLAAASTITPPYLGRCVVVKQDDAKQFKLRSHVVEA